MSAARTAARSADAVLAELRDIAAQRTEARTKEQALYARQVALYVEAREAVDPPVRLKDVAEAAGATVVAVDAAVAKYHGRRNGA